MEIRRRVGVVRRSANVTRFYGLYRFVSVCIGSYRIRWFSSAVMQIGRVLGFEYHTAILPSARFMFSSPA